jgi:hypothetical protein
LIDFDFSGYGNVQYPLNFAQYLPDAGVRPVVVGWVSAVDDVMAYVRILRMLKQQGGPDPAAFSNAMVRIEARFDRFIALVDQLRVDRYYNSAVYDEVLDKLECKASVSFLEETISDLRSASIDIWVHDIGLRNLLLAYDVGNRQKMTMPGDIKTPDRFE